MLLKSKDPRQLKIREVHKMIELLIYSYITNFWISNITNNWLFYTYQKKGVLYFSQEKFAVYNINHSYILLEKKLLPIHC